MSSLFRKMNTRRLRNKDIKKLVCVLRNDRHELTDQAENGNSKAAGAAIKKLPRRLRSSPLSSRGSLCHDHMGLDANLIDDIWSWIKYELEVGIGRFLYPIIMSGILSESEERCARQLEPVVRMFHPDWTLAGSPPPGIPPIDAGDKWVYQQNGCPACMLTRLGSDEAALFALFAGMYGHLRSRSGGQNGVDKIKSKRMRFVRYWMCTYEDGEKKTFDAYDLGVELKALRREAKATLRQSDQPVRYTRDNLNSASASTRPRLEDEEAIDVDFSDPYNPKDWTTDNSYDSKLGPIPPPDPTTATSVEGWNRKPPKELPRVGTEGETASLRSIHNAEDDTLPLLPAIPHTKLKHRDSVLSASATEIPPHRPVSYIYSSPSRVTLKSQPTQTAEDDTLSPLPVLSHANLRRRDSLLSSAKGPRLPRPVSSIYTSPSLATSIASFNNPGAASTHNYRYDPFDTPEERLGKYRRMLNNTPMRYAPDKAEGKVQFQGRLLPKPSRGSLYSAFGEEGRDGAQYDEVDDSPPPSPTLKSVEEKDLEDVEDNPHSGLLKAE